MNMSSKTLPLPVGRTAKNAPPPVFYHLNPLRTMLFGHPMETTQEEQSRLPKLLALPIFSSDAISSVAYATQQILLAFGAAGLAAVAMRETYTRLTLGVTVAIVFLLVVVASSYWQTIFGYPAGGGSYVVSKTNLGTRFGLIAGAALLIDYVLTVAVSIASGAQNMLSTPFFEQLITRWQVSQTTALVGVSIFFIILVTLGNLRGLKETGSWFAIPTYFFVSMASLMIVLGIVGPWMGLQIPVTPVNQDLPAGAPTPTGALVGFVLVGVVLKAFANGCSAMTGVEAISNCTPSFRQPQARNAALTLAMMAGILAFLFVGISWLSVQLHVVYWEWNHQTSAPVIDQLAGAVFGKPTPGHPVHPLGAFLYYCMQFSTTAILLLAANTSFSGFPRLASIMANDRFMPRPLSNLGDKLVFSNGIVLLGVFSIALIVIFTGSVDNLIPLYAVGVFTAFTLSQAGMVRHWWREKGARWQIRAAINGMGALLTGIVLVNILYEKRPEHWSLPGFLHSSWIVVLLGLILIWMFNAIHRHYEFLGSQLTLGRRHLPPRLSNTVLVLIPGLHRGILGALAYARSVSSDCRGIHISIDPEQTDELRKNWEESVGDEVPLVILQSPYRSLTGPLTAYLDEVRRERNHVVTVILPEFVSDRWWHSLLHNNSALQIKWALLNRPGVVVSNARYFLSDRQTQMMYNFSEEVNAS